MVCAPSDEGPVRAMPETAQQEDDEGIPDHFCFRYAAAAQRDIDIVPKPSRQ